MVLASQSLAVDTDVTRVSEQELAALWPWVALAQGTYYVLTGVWSLVHIRSFQAVTGPKTDLWLVKTVGVLVLAIGGVLCSAGLRRQAAPEIPSLAVGSAVGLAGIDVVYVARRRIARIYLLDALAECLFAVFWGLTWFRSRR